MKARHACLPVPAAGTGGGKKTNHPPGCLAGLDWFQVFAVFDELLCSFIVEGYGSRVVVGLDVGVFQCIAVGDGVTALIHVDVKVGFGDGLLVEVDGFGPRPDAFVLPVGFDVVEAVLDGFPDGEVVCRLPAVRCPVFALVGSTVHPVPVKSDDISRWFLGKGGLGQLVDRLTLVLGCCTEQVDIAATPITHSRKLRCLDVGIPHRVPQRDILIQCLDGVATFWDHDVFFVRPALFQRVDHVVVQLCFCRAVGIAQDGDSRIVLGEPFQIPL